MRRNTAESKIVKPAGVFFQEFSSNSIRDIIAVLQIPRSSFGPVRVRIIGRVHEQILPYLFHHAPEERFVALAAEEDPAGFQVMAGRMTNEIPGIVTGILKMIVHPFHMGWDPADSAFKKRKLEILVAIQ